MKELEVKALIERHVENIVLEILKPIEVRINNNLDIISMTLRNSMEDIESSIVKIKKEQSVTKKALAQSNVAHKDGIERLFKAVDRINQNETALELAVNNDFQKEVKLINIKINELISRQDISTDEIVNIENKIKNCFDEENMSQFKKSVYNEIDIVKRSAIREVNGQCKEIKKKNKRGMRFENFRYFKLRKNN